MFYFSRPTIALIKSRILSIESSDNPEFFRFLIYFLLGLNFDLSVDFINSNLISLTVVKTSLKFSLLIPCSLKYSTIFSNIGSPTSGRAGP